VDVFAVAVVAPVVAVLAADPPPDRVRPVATFVAGGRRDVKPREQKRMPGV
jgi:hypothetical protein